MQGCEFLNCTQILSDINSDLWWISFWAFTSKLGASIIGVVTIVSGTIVATKWLNGWGHYVASAVAASGALLWNMLLPMEEYRQFRSAQSYLQLHRDYLLVQPTDKRLKCLVYARWVAHDMLKETWPVYLSTKPDEKPGQNTNGLRAETITDRPQKPASCD